MGYSITFEVPVLDTDPNKTRGRHWTTTKSNNDKIKSAVRIAARNIPEKPLQRFQLSITRLGPRALDYDNLIASFKGYIDALKHVGIIEDDRWQFIKSINVDQRTSSEKKLWITVEEV